MSDREIEFTTSRRQVPHAPSAASRNSMSDERKAYITEQIKKGEFKEGFGSDHDKGGLSPISFATFLGSNSGIKKEATIGNNSGSGESTSGNAWSGSGGTVRQGPEIYSPLWLTSNTHLPRDRGTMNAWARAFFALNPIVNNAITLHSTYPISRLNITCPNKKIEDFFNAMAEEMDLANTCVQMAQEFFVIGEVFPKLDIDVKTRKWSRCTIQNPDYIFVKRTPVPSEPEISIRPDAELRRIVINNDPESRKIRAQISPEVLKYVRAGKNVPLDNFYISHLARKVSPYETRGTSLIASCFKALMLWDKLRECKYAQADNLINPITLVKLGGSADAEFKVTEADLLAWRELLECHDEETEVLTNQGYKKFHEVIEYNKEDLGLSVPCKPKDGIKIACFNPDTEELEYHEPSRATLYNHDGEMYHYKNDKIDINVTPNHKMWVSEKKYEYNGHRSSRKTYWGDWHKVEARDLSLKDYSRFRSCAKWIGNDDVKTVDVLGNDVSIELYLEFLGYLISEGCIQETNISLSQTLSKHYNKMRQCLDAFGDVSRTKTRHSITKSAEDNRKDYWHGYLKSKELSTHFRETCGNDYGNVKSYHKRVPRWIMELSPRLLKILLDALVAGDGSIYDNPKKQSNRFAYYTVSKQLADDVYEIAYKCGFVPTSFIRDDEKYLNGVKNRVSLYTILWSTSDNGRTPLIYKTSRNSQTKEKHNNLHIENYKGKVWCFTVPTGLFITRRCGKTTIQSNSAQYDKDFKIITHGSVTIERIGAQSVIDINADLERLIKEIYIGLMVPQVIMESGDITYANGSLSLDVLKQRYLQFQNMLAKWIKTKVFAPIAQLHDFWEYEDGEQKLIIPNIEWNHMNLFDLTDYISQLSQLVGERKLVSVHTLYRSLGLDYEDEQRKIRQENIDEAIQKRESEILSKLSLTELRALDDEDEIPDIADHPVPGESPEEAPSAEAGGGEAGGMGGMGEMGGGMPPPPGGGSPA